MPPPPPRPDDPWRSLIGVMLNNEMYRKDAATTAAEDGGDFRYSSPAILLNSQKEAKENIAEKAKTAYNIAIAVLAVAIFVCSLRHTEEGKQSYG